MVDTGVTPGMSPRVSKFPNFGSFLTPVKVGNGEMGADFFVVRAWRSLGLFWA